MSQAYCDPVTGESRVSEQDALWAAWRRDCRAFLGQRPAGDPSQLCLELWRWLDEPGRFAQGHPPDRPFCAHARDTYVTDHSLLASALVACLAHGRPLRDLWRLALLTHEFPHGSGPDEGSRERWLDLVPEAGRPVLEQVWAEIDRQEARIEAVLDADAAPNPLRAFLDASPAPPDELAEVWYAHLAASERLHSGFVPPAEDGRPAGAFLGEKADVLAHPLCRYKGRVALVYGGATKIKEYVFESARLPEVRGASSLLDRLNLLDVPALWNCRPYDRRGWAVGDEHARYRQVLHAFQRVALDAPECLIYAGGGNFLALAPDDDSAALLADAAEQLYMAETLVAKSVAVTRSFKLIELQYGCKPDEYWLDDYLGALDKPDLQPILESTYGDPNVSRALGFLQRKTFGQLVTDLTSAANRRRAGNREKGRQSWPMARYESLPQAIKCHSCDVRSAIVSVELVQVPPGQTPKVFCEACARKRVAGQVAKQDNARTRWFETKFGWWPRGVPSWEQQFLDYVRDRFGPRSAWEGTEAAIEVGDIGAASAPTGYVGFIYADGNNVGSLVARIAAMSAYRQFGQRLVAACREAVFDALCEHLAPHRLQQSDDPQRIEVLIKPFEILTIGGDDLSLIVPADKSLDIACAIGQKFEELLQGPLAGKPPEYEERFTPARSPADQPPDVEPKVSLSAGVALAHDNTPISYVEKLAGELMKAAKKGAKVLRDAHYYRGTVEFAALKTTGMVSLPWDEFRKHAYADDAIWRLTARPYTWAEMAGLLETIRELAGARLPHTQIYRLQRELLRDQPLQATIDYLYFFGRLTADQQLKLMDHFQKAWHEVRDVPPWRSLDPKQKQHETIWRDLVELYDFVRRHEEAS